MRAYSVHEMPTNTPVWAGLAVCSPLPAPSASPAASSTSLQTAEGRGGLSVAAGIHACVNQPPLLCPFPQ